MHHAPRAPLRASLASAHPPELGEAVAVEETIARLRGAVGVAFGEHAQRDVGEQVAGACGGGVGARARALACRLACCGVPGEIRVSALCQILSEARNHDGGALLLQKHAALAANSDYPRRHIVLQVEPGCRRA